VLILVSPFSTVDAALKSLRLALLSTVTLTSFANPYVGAAWALVIIVVSYFLSGWALRLMVFGTTFAWDLVSFRHTRFQVNEGENWVFTARSMDETPIRSFGRLSRGENGQLVLRYRPWLVLRQKQLVLPSGTYAVGRGLVYPEVMRMASGLSETVLTLPPRYRGHEEEFGQVYLYRLNGVEDVGFKALWAWLKGAVQSKPAAALPG
jgi:hypothetical protein